MKILLLGKNGQVGWELQRSLAPLGEVIALDRHGDRVGSGELTGDLNDLQGLERTIAAVRPQIIVNAAAYTAVDQAESEPDLAHRVNAEAPGVLARAAAKQHALLVHYSTDYVFDGGGNAPWKENDATGPLSIYGRTKLAGEQAIQASGCRYLIFRTSWVYAAQNPKGSGNFAKTLLRLAAEQDELKVINDQFGAPTGADLLADVTAHAVRRALLTDGSEYSGVYHLAAAGETNWFDYARFVLEHAQQKGRVFKVAPQQVQAIPTSAYPTPARRPGNSRLDCARLHYRFGLTLPRWQAGVARMLDEIL